MPCSVEYATAEGKYELIPMFSVYEGEELRVIYLTPEKAQKYLVHFEDGVAHDPTGRTLNGKYIFVMDKHGAIYASDEDEFDVFHHSSFLGGKPVASAGRMVFHDGHFKRIDDGSGHYEPARKIFDQLLTELTEVRGVSLKGVKINHFDDPSKSKIYIGIGIVVTGLATGGAKPVIHWLSGSHQTDK